MPRLWTRDGYANELGDGRITLIGPRLSPRRARHRPWLVGHPGRRTAETGQRTIRHVGSGGPVDDTTLRRTYPDEMRERRLSPIPSVLASTLVALLLAPMAAMAASGLPSTITMSPASAGPGSVVEVVGIDFPGGQQLELQLTTTAGPVSLATTTVEEGGYFRQSVTFPADVAPGFWELRATAANGTAAVQIFESTAGTAIAPAAEQVAATTPAAVGSGALDGNLITLIVLALLIGGVGGAAVYVYQQIRHPKVDPGMAAGEDPIWAGASGETQ